MKYMFYILILITIICWYPTYDLYTKEEFFDEHSSLVKTNFMTTVGCPEAANEMKAKYYQCKSKAQRRRRVLEKNTGSNKNTKDEETEYPVY